MRINFAFNYNENRKKTTQEQPFKTGTVFPENCGFWFSV